MVSRVTPVGVLPGSWPSERPGKIFTGCRGLESPLCCMPKALCDPLVRMELYDPMDHSPPGISVHGVLQARKLEWVALPSSRLESYNSLQIPLVI